MLPFGRRRITRLVRTACATGALCAVVILAGCGGGGGASTSASGRGGTGSAAYTVTDLGATTYGYYYFAPAGIGRFFGVIAVNDAGQVVTDATDRAAMWQNGTLTYLATPYSEAEAINNAGSIAGLAYAADKGTYQATVWSGGQPAAIGALLPSGYSIGYGINGNGDVVGESSAPTQPYRYHAFLFANGALTDLGTLAGSSSHASAVNSARQVVGWSTYSDNTYYYPVHAFVWQNGTMTDLGTLAGGSSSDAYAINDAGQIVGSSDGALEGLFGFRPLHAVMWQNGIPTDLGSLGGPSSAAYGINQSGQIVGTANTASIDNSDPYYFGGSTTGAPGAPANSASDPIGGGASAASGRSAARGRGIGDTYVAHAFLYSAGKMTDLNTLIPADSGWELVQAQSISGDGKIAGFGLLNKRIHAFLLTPQ